MQLTELWPADVPPWDGGQGPGRERLEATLTALSCWDILGAVSTIPVKTGTRRPAQLAAGSRLPRAAQATSGSQIRVGHHDVDDNRTGKVRHA